jgi:hypothetical protein
MPTQTQPPVDQLASPQTDPSTNDSSVMISTDIGFHLLQNSRRRAVLRYLLDHTGEVATIRAVAEQVAAWETETPVARLTGATRQRVHIALYQCHLPKLAETGVIEYNRERGSLVATPLVRVFAPYLDAEFHPDAVLTLDTATDA